MKASDRFRHGCGDFRRGGVLATIWPTCFILIGLFLLNYREA
jgi:hypothetical protein